LQPMEGSGSARRSQIGAATAATAAESPVSSFPGASLSTPQRSDPEVLDRSSMSVEEREAADLQEALLLSQTMT